jgi:hypothetical protein
MVQSYQPRRSVVIQQNHQNGIYRTIWVLQDWTRFVGHTSNNLHALLHSVHAFGPGMNLPLPAGYGDELQR